MKNMKKMYPQTCVSISCLHRNDVITDARSLHDSGVIRPFVEDWFVIINIRQCHIHKDNRWPLVRCSRGSIKGLYFQVVCRFRLSIQWRVNVYLSGSWLNTKTSIFVSSCYLVSDVEMKNDKELFNALPSAFLTRKKTIEDSNSKRRREQTTIRIFKKHIKRLSVIVLCDLNSSLKADLTIKFQTFYNPIVKYRKSRGRLNLKLLFTLLVWTRKMPSDCNWNNKQSKNTLT